MNKIISLAFLIFGIPSFNLAQVEDYKPLNFVNFEPDFISITMDETVVPDSTKDQYSFNLASFIVDNVEPVIDYPYMYTVIKTGYFDLEGYIVEKRDLTNGEILWNQPIDLRHIDRQESPGLLFLTNNAQLRLVNYRKIDAPPNHQIFPYLFALNGDESIISILDLDVENGNIISHDYPTSINDSVAMIQYSVQGLRSIFQIDENEYLYGEYKADGYNSGGLYCMAKLNDFHYQNKDTLIAPLSSNVDSNSIFGFQHRFYYHKDKLITINYENKLPNYDSWNCNIAIFDQDLNLEKINDISDLTYPYKNVRIKHIDDNFVIVTGSHEISDSSYIQSFNFEGELLETIQPYSPETNNEYEWVVERLNDSYQLLMLGWDNENRRLDILKSDGYGNLVILKTLTLESDDYGVNPAELQQLENGDIICLLNHGKLEVDQFGRTIWKGNWQNWVKISAIDLGLVSMVDNFISEDIRLYPNPTTGIIKLPISDMLQKVVVIDEYGRVHKNEPLHPFQTEIDVSFLTSGVYIVQIINNDGITYTTKLVKN